MVCRTYHKESSKAAIFGNQDRVPKVSGNQVTLRHRDGLCWFRSHQLANTIRQLCAIAGPIIDTVALQVHSCGGCARIVGAHHFNGTAVTGPVLFNNDDAIVGLLTRSNARQTDHQHGNAFQNIFNLSYRWLKQSFNETEGRLGYSNI
jgi:hypothetical protein